MLATLFPTLYGNVTAPAVLVIEAAVPVAVSAALLIHAPPVTRRPVRTRPAAPAATLPASRFSGWRDCHRNHAPATKQISAPTYIAVEAAKPPAVENSCAMVWTCAPIVPPAACAKAEAGTAKAVREHREAARPIVAGLGGRIVKTTGDGLLLEFPSVVAAVECAVAIQKLMVERNAETPETKRIVYRIGVNLGDVLIEGDDILGDGVNIAARLEGICEPGGVLISGAAYDHVRGRVDADFVDLGEKELKNIARPVRVYSVASR